MRFIGLHGLAIAALSLGPPTARAACVLAKVADLPVTMDGARPLVNAKFNGRDIRMLADSGAFYSMISRADAQMLDLSLQPAPTNFFLEGVGGAVDVEVSRVETFTIAGVDIHGVEFLVGGSSVGAVGLLGRNVLAMDDTEYDLGEGAIRLFRPRGCGRADLGYWAGTRPEVVVPMDWSDAATPPAIIDVKVDGVTLRALLDTGAASSTLSLAAARRVGIDVDSPNVARSGMSLGVGRRLVRAWLAPVSTFEVGGEKISNVKIGVIDSGASDHDMLLGADFFLSHRVLISRSQRQVYITYQGGPVFDLAQHPRMAVQNRTLADIAEPTDAAGYSRRGAAYQARDDTDRALADFDKAVAMAPREPSYLVQRARARLSLHRNAVAMSDIDAALTLDPGDTDALALRARLRRQDQDATGELSDLDAAGGKLPPQAVERLQLGQLYLQADRFDAAIAEFDQWVRYHPDDARLGDALNGRCWARALQGRDLDQALSDCNRAVRLYPNSAQVRDSRALVRLRRGEYARAIGDYDAALKIAPKMVWSLYGRGLAELKTGATEAGHADIAAAEALAPKLSERVMRFGLASDAGNAASPSTPTAPGARPPG